MRAYGCEVPAFLAAILHGAEQSNSTVVSASAAKDENRAAKLHISEQN